MSTPNPPKEFQSWLDYAVATMDARDAYLVHIRTGDQLHSPDDIRAAAQEELDQLRMKSVMPWIRILEVWKTKLSERLRRSEEDILAVNLLATDFSEVGVHIRFEDGTDLTFRRAFHLEATPADNSIRRAVVFTEHCGYHEFWIGPNDRVDITRNPSNTRTIGLLRKKLKVIGRMQVEQGGDAEQRLATHNLGQISEEELAWDAMAPVGREFGSPDYEKLMTEDAAEFASDLARWIQQCAATSEAQNLTEDELALASNVQLALHELGQDVTIGVAASVWKNYSQSLMADWQPGAETVQSAAMTLYINCPRQDKKV